MSQPDIQGERLPEERSLVELPKPGQMGLTAGEVFLQRTGFSPLFASRLSDLNDSLTGKGLPIESVGINLIPGKNPTLHYSEQYGSKGYEVSVRSRRAREAYLLISHNGEGAGLDIAPLGATLDDIQEFFRAAFPGQRIDLHAFTRHNERFVPYPNINSQFPLSYADLTVDLMRLSERVIERSIDFRRSREQGGVYKFPQVALTRVGQEEPVMIADIQARVNHSRDNKKGFDLVVFHPRELLIVDTPQRVEEALEPVARFFDKPELYPYRYVDIHK